MKQREASFRLLFDGNPVPMIVCALDDESILGVNDAAVAHYGYDRAAFETLNIRSISGVRQRSALGQGRSRATSRRRAPGSMSRPTAR